MRRGSNSLRRAPLTNDDRLSLFAFADGDGVTFCDQSQSQVNSPAPSSDAFLFFEESTSCKQATRITVICCKSEIALIVGFHTGMEMWLPLGFVIFNPNFLWLRVEFTQPTVPTFLNTPVYSKPSSLNSGWFHTSHKLPLQNFVSSGSGDHPASQGVRPRPRPPAPVRSVHLLTGPMLHVYFFLIPIALERYRSDKIDGTKVARVCLMTRSGRGIMQTVMQPKRFLSG